MSKEVIVCGFDNTREIAKKVAKSLSADYSEIICTDFPDGEMLVRIKENLSKKKVIIISSMAHEPDRRIIETLFAADIARDNRAKEVILFATYFPYLRQDKSFNNYESVSARHLMNIFSQKFDKIFVIDPHLHRINSLREYTSKAREVSSINIIIDYLKNVKEDFVVVGPDEESYQWARTIANPLKKQVHILIKKRNSSTNVKVSGENFSLKGKNVVIVDDIISTGHTLAESLKLIKSKGANKITCIGIHGIFAGNAENMIKKYSQLITTNTIPSKYSKIDVSPLISETLKKAL